MFFLFLKHTHELGRTLTSLSLFKRVFSCFMCGPALINLQLFLRIKPVCLQQERKAEKSNKYSILKVNFLSNTIKFCTRSTHPYWDPARSVKFGGRLLPSIGKPGNYTFDFKGSVHPNYKRKSYFLT